MRNHDEVLVQQLAPDNNELRRLMSQHEDFEREIAELTSYRWLSEEERVRLRELKKRKLLGRDRIQAILATHRAN